MQKPITIRYNELVDNLFRDIADSQLPAFVVLYILRDLINKVRSEAMEQVRIDEDAYQKALEEAEKAAESEKKDGLD